MPKRNIKVAVISDTHLGTYGCHAKELNTYLKSIDPEILIINGDFIDIWNLSKCFHRTPAVSYTHLTLPTNREV